MSRERERAAVERWLGSGDEEAFRGLYRAHAPALYRHALRHGSGPADAEEIVQETWLRAARGLGSFRWEASLRGWLMVVARNVALERRRKGARLVLVEEPEERAAERRPDVGVDLERAVAGLGERAREVLLLHDVEGLTHEEIAEVLEIEVGTSKSQLSRARATLRRALGMEVDHG